MKLTIKCTACAQPFELKETALTRSELEDKIGNYFMQACPHCGRSEEYHVNDVTATGQDRIKQAGRIAAALIALGCFYFAQGDRWIMGLGLFIAGAIFFGSRQLAAAQSNVDIFNSIYLKEKKQTDS
jgi:predicted nucleic-acid-binding Zn-ribbon protein